MPTKVNVVCSRRFASATAAGAFWAHENSSLANLDARITHKRAENDDDDDDDDDDESRPTHIVI
jgi:hypothetical protein